MIKDLPDGTRIVTYPDGGELHIKPFPQGDGIRVDRRFDRNGQLISETHLYGLIDLSITSTFENGVKIAETYIRRNRMVSRKTYEKARSEYPDMPPADPNLPDHGANLLRRVREERRAEQIAAKAHKPDPQQATQSDAFCVAMLGRGTRANAVEWIQTSTHTLGEMNHRASRGLVSTLSRLGCTNIFACEIAEHPDDVANTGHLVVELPAAASQRTALFKKLARLAQDQGYSGDLDNGQTYVYVKLD